MDTKRRTDKDEINTTVRVPRTVHERLRDIAEKEDRSVSGEVRRLIQRRVDEYEAPEKTAA